LDGPARGAICRVGDVPDGDALGFEVDAGGGAGRIGVIVVRRGEVVHVYRNRCPHRGTPLDWRPDRFLDAAGEHLICATHGALFRLEDGVCVAGPCAGDALTPVAVVVEAGSVRLAGP